MRPELMICFPPGGGGNFVISEIYGRDYKSERANEYYHATVGCPLDFEPASRDRWDGDDGLESHLWKLHGLAEAFSSVDWESNGFKCNIAKTHHVPYMTHRVFDIRSREMVYIEPDPGSSWFIHMLQIAKHSFNGDIKDLSLTIGSILDMAVSSGLKGQIRPDMYQTPMEILKGIKDDVRIENTVAAWEYIIGCMARNETASVRGFKLYVDRLVSDTAILDRRMNRYYFDATESLKRYADQTHRYSYSDIFFNLDIPTNGMLSNLNVDAVRDYTISNIKVGRELSEFMTPMGAERLSCLLDYVARKMEG